MSCTDCDRQQVDAPTGLDVRNVLCFECSGGFGGSGVSLARLISHIDPQRYRFHAVVTDTFNRDYLSSHSPVGSLLVDSAKIIKREYGLGRMMAATIGKCGRAGHLVTSGAIAGLNLAGPVPRFTRRIRKAFGHRRFDAVWLNNTFTNTFGVGSILARGWNVPLVCKMQGFAHISPTTRWLARKVDLFLTDSWAVAEPLRVLGVPKERIHPTYCAVDVVEFDPAQRSPRGEFRHGGGRSDMLAFGIIGQLLEWKGQQVFLEAAKKIFATRQDCVAIIVGSEPDRSGKRLRELQAYAEQSGIADRVRFVGHRDDVPQVMAELDIVVHGSIRPEPFGTVIAEAMAMQRPVVAARAGGPMEFVKDGENGFLAEPGNSDQMAAAIIRLLDDPDLRRRMGENGRRTVIDRFSAQKHARDTEELLDRAIESRRRE